MVPMLIGMSERGPDLQDWLFFTGITADSHQVQPPQWEEGLNWTGLAEDFQIHFPVTLI